MRDGAWMGNLVAVKNAARPPDPNGEKTIWACYVFGAEPDSNCYTCHKSHGLKDNVWVQFYPTLRDLLKR